MTILLALGVVLTVIASLFFSALTYALREVSRARLGDWLDVHGKTRLLEPTVRHQNDLIFITAAGRLITNVIMLLLMLRLFQGAGAHWWTQYLFAMAVTVLITLFCSVAI